MWLVTIVLDSAILVERAILIPQSPGSSLDQVIHLLCVSKGGPCLSGPHFAQPCNKGIRPDDHQDTS